MTYGSKTRTVVFNVKSELKRWERKVLRIIYRGVLENGKWRIRANMLA